MKIKKGKKKERERNAKRKEENQCRHKVYVDLKCQDK
jgi:hypothetical protein